MPNSRVRESKENETETVTLFSSLVVDTFPFYKYPYCRFPAEAPSSSPENSPPLFSIETLDGRKIMSLER